MVSIARALSRDSKLLILDEPTASLSNRETDVLIEAVRRLQNEGRGILYVSHRLGEIFELANRVTVLRDGALVQSSNINDLDETALIRAMVGRETVKIASPSDREVGDTVLEVRDLSGSGFQDISLSVRSGEVVGLAGLVGAGRSELARAIVGLDTYDRGEVFVEDRAIPPNNLQASLARGLALVPEDRQHEGLVLPMSVSENMSMAVLSRLTKRGFVSKGAERDLVAGLKERLDVRTASTALAAESLSGGNQQKVVLGKWLATEPKVLILDEPTRGVDVGAKAQVHHLVRELADNGMATLIISSDLPELLTVCDRILAMREGTISGEVGANASQEKILELALPDTVTT